MKKKVINAAICDAREVTEDSLQAYESTEITAAVLIEGKRAKDLLSRYPVSLNVATVLEIPDEEDIEIKTINGSDEIGPDTDGTGVCLIVNGNLTVASGSLEAVKSFCKVFVNGTVRMPRSMKGQCQNMTVNGSAEYYPDGAVILKSNTAIDDLFAARAENPLYYCSKTLYFLDDAAAKALVEKNIKFEAHKFIVSEKFAVTVAALFNEDAEIVRVPQGAVLVKGDLELNSSAIRKYGPRICVTGNVTVNDAQALSQLNYLFADGCVQVSQTLEEAFNRVSCVCAKLEIIDTDRGRISDRVSVKIGKSVLKKYPAGVDVIDCAKVTLSKDLTPDEILERLCIYDCALVCCSDEQEEAVSTVCKDVADIEAGNSVNTDVAEIKMAIKGEESGKGILSDILSGIDEKKNADVIDAAQYKM